jgi:peptide/nickel transport system substrate-binding protein
MKGRLWGAVALSAAGAALLTASALAGSSAPQATDKQERRGGTLRIDLTSDFDYIDTTLAYFSQSWQMLNATQLKLLSFPDQEGAAGTRMVAEAATGLPRVSADGKTYTFTIKPGFRFSDGSAVTAANFAHAFRRALDGRMQSPASSFLDDVESYRAADARTFVVRMKEVAPDFLARMTMPFFSAIPTSRPIVAEGVKAPLVSAGPYYLREWTEGQSALIVRNPYWNNAREPWRSLGRPAHVDRMTYAVGVSPQNQRLRAEANQTDLATFPPQQAKELVDKYGLNKSQLYFRKQLVFWYIVLNNERPLFKDNLKLRQAVNHAIDRPHLVRQHGFLGGGRTDQILPPGMPGFRDADLYPLKGADVARARQLAQGATRDGKAVMYTFNVNWGPTVAQAVQFQLKQIGIDVEIKVFDRVVQHQKLAVRGEPFDLAVEGWGADYPDPANFMNVLFDGRRIQKDNNVNMSYFNDPAYNRKLEEAYRLAGDARLTNYGRLDADIMRNAAPIAPYINTNGRILTSKDLGCFTYSNVNSATNLVAVCKMN